MRTGNNGRDLIKYFEGLRLKAYLDRGGVPTIGWGHTKGVNMGDKVTEDQAEKLFEADLFTFEREVDNSVFAAINQNQFDALVSFTYNVGGKALETSSVLKELNAGNYSNAASNFHKWVYSAGSIDPVLIRRRGIESRLFLTPVNTTFTI